MHIEKRNIDGKDFNMYVLTKNDTAVLNKYFAGNIFKNKQNVPEIELVKTFLSAFKGKIVDRLFKLAGEGAYTRTNITYMRYLLNNLAKNNRIIQGKIPDQKVWNEITKTNKKVKAKLGRINDLDGKIKFGLKEVTNIDVSHFTEESALKSAIVSCNLNSIASKLISFNLVSSSVYISQINIVCKKLGIEYQDNPINKLYLCASYLNALERNETASDFSSWALPVLRDQEEIKKVFINGFTRKNFYNFLTTHDINIIDFDTIFNSLAQLLRNTNTIDEPLPVNTYTVNGPLPGNTYTINGPLPGNTYTIDRPLPVNTYMLIGGPSANVYYSNSTDNVLTYEEIMSQNQRYTPGFNPGFNPG